MLFGGTSELRHCDYRSFFQLTLLLRRTQVIVVSLDIVTYSLSYLLVAVAKSPEIFGRREWGIEN